MNKTKTSDHHISINLINLIKFNFIKKRFNHIIFLLTQLFQCFFFFFHFFGWIKNLMIYFKRKFIGDKIMCFMIIS